MKNWLNITKSILPLNSDQCHLYYIASPPPFIHAMNENSGHKKHRCTILALRDKRLICIKGYY